MSKTQNVSFSNELSQSVCVFWDGVEKYEAGLPAQVTYHRDWRELADVKMRKLSIEYVEAPCGYACCGYLPEYSMGEPMPEFFTKPETEREARAEWTRAKEVALNCAYRLMVGNKFPESEVHAWLVAVDRRLWVAHRITLFNLAY